MKTIINIGLFMFLILINIFVGSSLRDSLILINIIPVLTMLIYIIYCFIKKKKIRFLENKIDIILLIYLLYPIINIIIGNYASLNSQIELLLQNISLFCTYLLIKRINIKNNKEKIINLIILSSIPIIIIGIDKLCFNKLWDLLLNFNTFNTKFVTDRMTANFNYPNTLAIYLCSIIFLIFPKCNKENVFYKGYLYFLILFIFLTKSRASILLFVVFVVLYLIFNKDKELNKNIISCLLISIINCLLYFICYKIFKFEGLLMFFFIIFFFGFTLFIHFILKKYNILKKIQLKFNIKIILIIFILLLSYFIICVNISSPTQIIEKTQYYKFNISNKDSQKVKIDLNTKVTSDINRMVIRIDGVDTLSNKTNLIEDVIDEFSGTKEYDLNISSEIQYINITFENYHNNKMTVNKIYINDQEKIINYKYLPNSLMKKINNFSLFDKSIIERLYTYKDSFKIIKKHWLFGNGYKAWENIYINYRTYNYIVNVMHSSIIDVLINFGIFGLLILTTLIIYLIRYIKRNKVLNNITNYSLVFSMIIIILHSFIDIDLSFLLIHYYLIILSALIQDKQEKLKNKNEISIFIIMFLCIISLIVSINYFYVINKKSDIKALSNEEQLNEYKKLKKVYPYLTSLNYDYIFTLYNKIYEGNFITGKYDKEFLIELEKFVKYEKYTNNLDIQNMYVNYVINKFEKTKTIEEETLNNLHIILNDYNQGETFNYDFIIRRAKLLVILYKFYSTYSDNDFIETKKNEIKNMMNYEYQNALENTQKYIDLTKNYEGYEEFLEDYNLLLEKINN